MTLRLTLFSSIEPDPRKDWLVHGLLGAGEMSCLFGAPSSGKSVLAGDMACHIAAGKPWFGREVQQGAVLYVACERFALVKRRFAAWRKAYGLDDIPLGLLHGSIDLRSSRKSAEEIAGHARDLADMVLQPVRVVFVDTVSRALNGGDENSPRDMGALVGNVAAIQQATGAAVCLLHHIPADGTQRLRGHGALLGAADTTIAVEKAEPRTGTVDKANDSAEGERIAFTLESVEIADDGTTAPIVKPSDLPAGTAAKATRKLTDKQKLAKEILADLCISGKPLSNGHDLPQSIRAVPVEAFRDELYRRGALDRNHTNPREDFSRVKGQLLSRHLAGERDGMIWTV